MKKKLYQGQLIKDISTIKKIANSEGSVELKTVSTAENGTKVDTIRLKVDYGLFFSLRMQPIANSSSSVLSHPYRNDYHFIQRSHLFQIILHYHLIDSFRSV